ncbi:MAG: ferrous iron transport protein B [Bacteroidetes bacterium]|nr:ferrous iron transport protein B [Bacteroidota bacterium]MBS1558469.1 ferrous iron transport protein B [Bacteroidota bacterium]
MAADSKMKIALVGKPNSGKSSLFNRLTGLNQKIGNFPGVTVDKRTGYCQLEGGISSEIIDLPGTYSLYPRTLDEKVVAEVFADDRGSFYPEKVVLVADATNLKNCFLLLTQLIDLGLPTILALNMVDLAAKSGQSINIKNLEKELDLPVVMINARNGMGIDQLRLLLSRPLKPSRKLIYQPELEIKPLVDQIKKKFNLQADYRAYQFLQQAENLVFLPEQERHYIRTLAKENNFFSHKYQGAETVKRYGFIQDLLNKVVIRSSNEGWKKVSYGIDKVLTHKVWGYVIFFVALFLIFQSIFAWAQIPMDFIDRTFARLSSQLDDFFPEGPFFELLSHGIIPGIGGIVIFIPQIAILFAFISVFEETGYMSRVVFLMDKIMRKFGLNGKSVVPLMSGWACAIPAIMATRTIENWKDRLITIFVTPFMSCSARLPVFTILVALIIPDTKIFGFFNYQGLVLMGLYLLGFLAAILSAFAMKLIIKARERSYLIMEMPTYKMPKWSNVGFQIIEKTKAFVFEAGKIILAISIILYVLSSYGPADVMNAAKETVRKEVAAQHLSEEQIQNRIASYKLENSYAGRLGKTLEPLIKPLGYDWKIGIALVTSFAAREVFVGTIATIYSIGSTDDQATIKERLKSEVDPDTGKPRYTLAVGLSLLVFYTFAMQCMSTLAVVKRETKSWRWPLLQLAYMSTLAYFSALVVYQVLK